MRAPTIPTLPDIEKATALFVNYLGNNANNFKQLKNFVASHPWVLTEPAVCTAVAKNPYCYLVLKQFDWWNTILKNVPPEEELAALWIKNSHVLALAYEATDAQIEKTMDWPAWEILIQEYGPCYDPSKREHLFSRTKAFVELANRVDVKLAPLMCAAMHILLPLDQLSDIVNDEWSPLQKAQYAWLLTRTRSVGDIWPTLPQYQEPLREAQDELSSWINLVDPQELTSLHVVYELNNSDLAATIFEWIQLAQQGPSVEILDYTHALDNTGMAL